MSILGFLAKAYDRLPDAPSIGFSSESISFCCSLNEDGSLAQFIDLRDESGKKSKPISILVPTSFKRPGTTPRPFFLWDNVNYALGAGLASNPDDPRFQVFKEKHIRFLSNEIDIGLVAYRRFLEAWDPFSLTEYNLGAGFETMKVVFALETERSTRFLHQRERAQLLWSEIQEDWKAVEGKDTEEAICLVSGIRAPVARTHPPIKGIPSRGGKDADSIVSFNLDAFTSYGHQQGDNAPVSEEAAFKYTTVLNSFLERGSRHRIQIGDASTVFWADASDRSAADQAEGLFACFFDADGTDAPQHAEEADATRKVGIQLERIRKGERLRDIEPRLAEGIRFYVLGLAPNAARLSVRFFFEGSFGAVTAHYQKFVTDMEIEPPPRDGYPPLWRYLRETAVKGKSENVQPNLAGEWTRSILSGSRYPRSLMAAVLTRIRANGDINALRAGILKATLIRNFRKEVPVALDPDFKDRGYLLGRLFAAYEQAQTAALGSKVNATIKDKYYGSASAQPRKVFAMLESGSANHLSKVGKQSPGRRVNLEKLITSIMDKMQPDSDPFPAALAAEEQALFGLGYYHQRNEFFKKTTDPQIAGETAK